MTTVEVELDQLDVSDLDNWVGVPVSQRQPRYPFSENDIGRFAQAMDNPNPLHYDPDYAADSCFGRIVAPQSYLGGGAGTGAASTIEGMIPGSHHLFGGDEQWFYGPRIFPGDRLRLDRMLYDYKVTDTSFAGPTVFPRGDTTYVNQNGEFICKQRSTAIRYLASNAQKLQSMKDLATDPVWTDEQLADVNERRKRWILSWPRHTKRLWSDVEVGEALVERVIGPHSMTTFTSEYRSDQGGWGQSEYGPHFPSSALKAGWTKGFERDFEQWKYDPRAEDGLLVGSSRGHVAPEYAQKIGMPRGYGYGASMCAWTVDFLTNWAGEHGFLLHHKTSYRSPALTGDIAIVNGTVVAKWHDDEFDRGIVQVDLKMTNQLGTVLAAGRSEIILPES